VRLRHGACDPRVRVPCPVRAAGGTVAVMPKMSVAPGVTVSFRSHALAMSKSLAALVWRCPACGAEHDLPWDWAGAEVGCTCDRPGNGGIVSGFPLPTFVSRFAPWTSR
jgi:hypothetical protein